MLLYKEALELPKVVASIRIENVVASATLNQRIDLNAVVKGIQELSTAQNSFRDWCSG
jgi:TATA-box binding protein (TBP) (component of TFIID and TFIIIB)